MSAEEDIIKIVEEFQALKEILIKNEFGTGKIDALEHHIDLMVEINEVNPEEEHEKQHSTQEINQSLEKIDEQNLNADLEAINILIENINDDHDKRNASEALGKISALFNHLKSEAITETNSLKGDS